MGSWIRIKNRIKNKIIENKLKLIIFINIFLITKMADAHEEPIIKVVIIWLIIVGIIYYWNNIWATLITGITALYMHNIYLQRQGVKKGNLIEKLERNVKESKVVAKELTEFDSYYYIFWGAVVVLTIAIIIGIGYILYKMYFSSPASPSKPNQPPPPSS